MRRPLLALAITSCILIAACTTDRTRRGYLRRNASAYQTAPAHPVIVIPGFGVSRLLDPVTGRYVWGTPRATMRTRWPDDLDLPFDAASGSTGDDRLLPRGFTGSRGPVNTGWQLLAALEKYGGYEQNGSAYAFAYDWRRSALENARRLEELAAAVRRAHDGRRVDVVTHSAGGIVALAWVKLGEGGDDVRNLVLIAPPLRGTIEVFRMMVRPERFLRRTFQPRLVATWPSVAELLPDDGRVFVDGSGCALALDLWDLATWKRFVDLGASGPGFAASLRAGRAFRERLQRASLPAGVTLHVIAGDCVPTARRVAMRTDGSFIFYRSDLREHEQPLAATLFEPGDGTVPISSAASPGMQIFCDGHQGLASDPNVHRALLRILREDD